MCSFSGHESPRVRRVRPAGASLLLVLGLLTGCRTPAGSPEALQGLALEDQNGGRFEPSSVAGRVVLLNFMFSRCPGPCPRLTKLLSETLGRLPGSVRGQVEVLSVSVDPAHDTPDTLKRFAEEHDVDADGWRFLHVGPDDLEVLSKRLLVFDPNGPKTPPAHSMEIYLFDRVGRPLQRYDGNTVSSQHLAREVVAAFHLPDD